MQVPLRELVKKWIPEAIGKEIDKQCQGMFRLKDGVIRKVKIPREPKFEIIQLMELHQDSGDGDAGSAFGHPEDEAAKNTPTAEIEAVDDTAW